MNGTTPTGNVFYSDSDGNTLGPVTLSGGQATLGTIAFKTSSEGTAGKDVVIRYEPEPTNHCHIGSINPPFLFTVYKADTTVTIIHPYAVSGTGNPILVTVQLAVVAPGMATNIGPSGQVTIEIDTNGAPKSCTASVDLTMRTATCSVTPTRQGLMTIKATYAGNNDYNGSTASVTHNVVPPETATFLPPPVTATPLTPVPTTPPICPYFENSVLSFSTPPNSFTVSLRNRDTYNFKVSRVTVSWPTSGQTARLKEIRFSDAAGIGTACSNNNKAQCIWWANNNNQSLPNTNPLNVTSGSSGNWNGSNSSISINEQRYLYLLFTTDLATTGDYYLEVEFSDGAGHTCTTSPAINYTR